jgi:signal transduction histidine kinase
LKDSAEVGRKLLENLLEWSRTQLDNAAIKQETVKVKELTDEIIQLVGHSAQQKNISLVAEIDHSLQVKTDVNMLRTVIRNLTSNAVKFTPDSGRVSLHANIVNDHMEFWVKDTGIGISESDLPKLFRIDINPNSIGKSQEKGTGLGLIICKEFIEKNNGRIWVESKEGEGSIFKFTIPANQE